MSEEANVQIVRDAYAAYQRGDIQAILDSLSQDVQWIAANTEPVAGTYRGPAEVATFFQKVAGSVQFSHFEPQEYIARGDRVVVLGHYSGTAISTGRPLDCDWAMAFTVKDGKVSNFQEYTDTAAINASLQSASAATV